MERASLPGALRTVCPTYLECAQDVLGMPARDAATLIAPKLVLDGATRSPVVSHGNTTYLRRRSALRNVAWYFDKPSKLDPGGPAIFHAELRLAGKWLRAAGINQPEDLFKVTDEWLSCQWEKHVVLVDVDPGELGAFLSGRRRRLHSHLDSPPTDPQSRRGDMAILNALDSQHRGAWTVPAAAQAVSAYARIERLGDVLGINGTCAHAPASGQPTPAHVLGMTISEFIQLSV
jgi:hypothetical protein